MLKTSPRPTTERRGRPRNSHEGRATGLIQAVLQDPERAIRILETDLRGGVDPNLALTLLAAAQSKASLRGLDIGAELASVRQRLKRAGYLS
jgi:hypothetical protein